MVNTLPIATNSHVVIDVGVNIPPPPAPYPSFKSSSVMSDCFEEVVHLKETYHQKLLWMTVLKSLPITIKKNLKQS